MVEPISLTVTELAARWQCSNRQVFERAKFLGLLLHFHFDGEAYDVIEERKRTSFDWENGQEADVLQNKVVQIDLRLGRLAKGDVSEWEQSISPDDAAALRAERNAAIARLEALAEMFRLTSELRERSIFVGDLIAAPQTIIECEQNGSAIFPTFAYHPGRQVQPLLVQGALYGILDGRMLRLGPRKDARESLGADDLRARTADIRAIEAIESGTGKYASVGDTTTEVQSAPSTKLPQEANLTPKQRRTKLDITRERGARRRILERWDNIEAEYGPKADAHQVLRVLNRERGEEEPTLKTVQNRLNDLRRDGLLP